MTDARGGAPPSSTRSTRAASRTPTATGSATCRGSPARLDHLAELGRRRIWLSPVYPSPQDDDGYDISDYQDIDPAFGTLADFDALLAGVHARGMKLIMDLVVNHTSDEHPWFAESRASRDNPKRDWYWWRERPNNWGSFFSGSAWELDPATGEHYLHLFSRKQPDLNWENPEVRAAVYAMMHWWLDRGVDGFRMDVIDLISKVAGAARRRGRPRARATADSSTRAAARASTSSSPRCTARCSPAATRELLTVGEMPTVTLEEARLFTDPARASSTWSSSSSTSGSTRARRSGSTARCALTDLKASLGRWQEGLADVGWNSLYWNNHDQPRVVSRFGDDGAHRVAAAKMLGTVLHLHRGTPYVYQGEELGMTNAPWAGIEEFRDIESLNHYAEAVGDGADPEAVLADLRRASRDNARTPMQWDALRARRLHDRHAVARRSTRTTARSTPRRRAPTPTRSSTTTAG